MSTPTPISGVSAVASATSSEKASIPTLSSLSSLDDENCTVMPGTVPPPGVSSTPIASTPTGPAAVTGPVHVTASVTATTEPVAAPVSTSVAAPTAAASTSAPTTTPAPAVIGPLPNAKTITITFVPDWSQEDLKSPLRAASLCVLLGPANTLPQQALWCIEFNVFATDKRPSAVKNKDEESIGKGQRALLWYDGKAFPKYKNCIVLSKCRLPANDELKTQSIVLRTHGEERDPNALIWVRKRAGPKRRKDLSHLKVVAGHHYYLNITFAAGSTIAQLVGSQAWRPIIYLYAKRQKKGIDEIQSSRLFTNFTTNWAVGIEPNVNERELKAAAEALIREAEEDAENKQATKQAIAAARLVPTEANVSAQPAVREWETVEDAPAQPSSASKPQETLVLSQPAAVTKENPGAAIDLVFVIDATGSMDPVIDALKEVVQNCLLQIKEFKHCTKVRVCVILYRDHDQQYPWVIQQMVSFTDNIDDVIAAIKQVKTLGGSSTPEAVTDGLACLERIKWDKNAAKLAILMGDAPPHGIVTTGLTDKVIYHECPCGEGWQAITQNLREIGATVHTVPWGSSNGSSTNTTEAVVKVFKSIAEETHGQSFYIPYNADANLAQQQLKNQLPSLILGAVNRELEQTRVARVALNILKDAKVLAELMQVDKNGNLVFDEESRAVLLHALLLGKKLKINFTNEKGQLLSRNITLDDFSGLIPSLRCMDPITNEIFPTWKGPNHNKSGLFVKADQKEDKEQEQIPLTGVDVNVDIKKGSFVEVTVMQSYENNSNKTLEVEYEFPIDSHAKVTGFIAKTATGIVRAECKAKEKAQGEYEQALKAGEQAFLLKQQVSGKFTMLIGNIEKDEKITIKLTYIQLLESVVSRDTGNVHRFLLPTTIAPKSTPKRAKNDLSAKAPTASPAFAASDSYNLKISMNVEMSEALTDIQCTSSHKIVPTANSTDSKKATVTLAGEATQMNRDFVVTFATEKPAFHAKPTCELEQFLDPMEGNDKKAQADVEPGSSVALNTNDPLPQESTWISAMASFTLVYDSVSNSWNDNPSKISAAASAPAFASQSATTEGIDIKAVAEQKNLRKGLRLRALFDDSESMNGNGATQIKKGMEYIPKMEFPADADVEVWKFASDAELIWSNQSKDKKRIGFNTEEDPTKPAVLTNDSVGGGTSVFRLIKALASDATKENPISIMLHTDGAIPEVDKIVNFIQHQEKGAIELYLTGVGNNIEIEPLRQLEAAASTAVLEFCSSQSLVNSIERHVERMTRGLRDVTAIWGDVLNQKNAIQEGCLFGTKANRSIVMSGEKVLTFNLLKPGQKTTVCLQGTSWNGEKYVFRLNEEIDTAKSSVRFGHQITRFAAAALIKDYSALSLGARKDTLKPHIIALSETFCVSSPETSFIARNKNKKVISTDAREKRIVKHQEPLRSEQPKDSFDECISTKRAMSSPTVAVMSVADVKSRGYMPDDDTRTGASLPSSLATAVSGGTGAAFFAAPAPNFPTKAAAAYQQSLSPMTAHLFPLQTRSDIPVEWPDVEAAINSKPLASIVLPSFDAKPFNTDFPLDSTVERFVNSEESTLSQALCAIEGVARTMATDSKSPHSDVAKHLLNCFSAISQLPGWQHVQNFMHNPQLYIENTKKAQKGDEIASGAMAKSAIAEGSIEDLQMKGIRLLRRLCQRIDWLLDLQRKANAQFNVEFYVKVIAADRAWAEDASSFMKEAETKVTEMLTKNPQKFHAFRELQRKGVQWPHSPALRTEIERAGFVFRPMMIKRDRMICETCGVEISGWRPWHNPWSFHNYAKHPPSFQPGVAVTLQPPTSQFIARMVTESNMRRGLKVD